MNEDLQMLHDLVVDAVADTPYTVTPADDGFDLHLDLADARWRTVLGRAGLSRSVTHEVRPKDGGYTVTDVVRRVDWVAGVPGLSGGASVQKGRVIEVGVEKAWGLDEHGLPIKVADFSYSTQEGRQLIDLAAESTGLQSRRGSAEKIGLAFFGIAAVGAVVTVVVLLVALALGKF